MPRSPRHHPNRALSRSRPPSVRRDARRAKRDTLRGNRQAEAQAVEERIARGLADSLRLCAAEPERIAERLRELESERSLESALAYGCSAATFAGVLFGLAGVRRWLIVAALASGLLLRETRRREGSPPLLLLRRLGLRTAREIDQERTALKLLRGDFGQLSGQNAEELATAALKAVGR
jgi:hypothetical protein